MTAVFLFLGATGNAPDYVQFAVTILLSCILIFYLAKEEPYVTRRINNYVLIMEITYFFLGMVAFSFTDAVPAELGVKVIAALGCLILLTLIVLSNLLVSCYFAKKGRIELRLSDTNHKEWRRNEV